MRRLNPRPVSNAAAEYAASRAEIARLLVKLDQKLVVHGAEQAKQPAHWGYVGDLEHIADLLRRTVSEGEE